MDSPVCKECGVKFSSDNELHKHIREHKMRVEQYYHKHFPRYDLLTGDPITFKDKEYYFTHSFNNRTNFKTWYEAQDSDTIKSYCLEFLQERKERKRLIYAPCQVELRTIYSPSMLGFQKHCGDYYEFCHALGLRVKYERFSQMPVHPLRQDYFVLVDTREQAPLSFSLPTKIQTLNFGDYAYGNDAKQLDVFIERKSLNDFVSTFSSGFERVKREMNRAMIAGKKLVVIVEHDLRYAMVFQQFLPFMTKITPEYVFHNVRQAIQEYPNVQFLFVKDRLKAATVIQKIFRSMGELCKYDLQFLEDSGLL